MPAMKSVLTTKDKVDVVDVERPVPGSKDLGGMPAGADGSARAIPLGHEPAGEIVEVGSEVRGPAVGNRVVVNPRRAHRHHRLRR